VKPTLLMTSACLAACLLIAPIAAPAQPTMARPISPAADTTRSTSVDPGALDALTKMGAYMRSLTAFELSVDTTTDELVEADRSVQLLGTATYKVRKPSGFYVEMASDRKLGRRYFFCHNVTLLAPRQGFYATVSAPATNRETVEFLGDEYDIEIPLTDLFRLGEPGDLRSDLTYGAYIGPARVGGVETDQYAFSTEDLDWQVWISRGDKPLPRKFVITSRSVAGSPQFSAVLNWNTSATLSDADFNFTPPAEARTITIAAVEPQN
jgi:hypothetical protein